MAVSEKQAWEYSDKVMALATKDGTIWPETGMNGWDYYNWAIKATPEELEQSLKAHEYARRSVDAAGGETKGVADASVEGSFKYYQQQFEQPEVQSKIIGADIVEEWERLQEEALADIGVFEFDRDVAQEEALKILAPALERELTDLKEDIKENRVRSASEYEASIRKATEIAQADLKRISISEAQNEQELLAMLGNIGAREAYEKAEQGRIMANAAEELQASLEEIRGRGEYLTDEQRRTIDETEEAFRIKVADIEGSREYAIEEKNRLIAEAQEALEINIRDITGQTEFAVETEERLIRETNEKLQRDIGDIGARKEYSYERARQDWDTRLAKEEEVQLGRGRGFSGVMREEMGNLATQKGADLGEIIRSYTAEEEKTRAGAEYQVQGAEAGITEARRKAGLLTERERIQERQTREEAEAAQEEIERRAQVERETAAAGREVAVTGAEARITEIGRERGMMEEEAIRREAMLREQAQARTGEIGRLATAQEEEAQREAMFTQERTQAAREEVEAQKARGIMGAQTEMKQDIRAYGYGTPYGEIPEEIRPAEPIPEQGIYGERERYGLEELKYGPSGEATFAQINELERQQREAFDLMRQERLETVPEWEEYESREKLKRGL